MLSGAVAIDFHGLLNLTAFTGDDDYVYSSNLSDEGVLYGTNPGL